MQSNIVPGGAARALLLSVAAFVCSGVFGAAALAAAPAPSPTPSPPPVRTIELTGSDLAAPIVIDSVERQWLHAMLAAELDWVAGSKDHYIQAGTQQLGPKYTALVSVSGQPKYSYDLYPLAEGGARIFRPAQQPGSKKNVEQGWFLAHLTLPITLRDAGVPLKDVPQLPPGTGGRGGGVPGAPTTQPPTADIEGMVGQWRRFVGLDFGVVLAIGTGLFLIAYLARRKA